MRRRIETVLHAPERHWVGNGFLVRPLFADAAFTASISPFLMLDWAAERRFPPSATPRGVGPHPHRGFETVTLVHAGEVAHRDSAGHADRIGPGDVQWMTAGAGLVHEEMLGGSIDEAGGAVSMAQLWVNLPKASKATPPRYQAITADRIPEIASPGVTLRLVAGSFGERAGPAATHTELTVAEATIAAGAELVWPVPDGWTAMVAVLSGRISADDRQVGSETVALFTRTGGEIAVTGVATESRLLLLAGEPIAEPIAAMGPFVMNTHEDLIRAVEDFRLGRMGRL